MNNKYKDQIILSEVSRCLLCADASCTKACPHKMDPAKFIRSVRFNNVDASFLSIDRNICLNCPAPCEEACIHYDQKIRIKDLIENIDTPKMDISNIDLSIDFLGVKCENPFFLSSSVVGSNYEMVSRALEAGWGGVVFKTIGFYKPNEVSPRFASTTKEGTPFTGFKNMEQISDHELSENLKFLHDLKKNYPSKVIVASIMGENEDEWTRLASLCEEAGVDIIECNFSCPQMAVKGMGSDVGQSEELVRSYTKATIKGCSIPVLAKMTPNIGNMEPVAISAMEAGAHGIAAINTIKSIVNVNLDNMQSDPNINGRTAVSGYSGHAVKPIALRFINDMKQNELLKDTPISGMGGIETWQDACEFIALGCENIQVTTAIMQYGYRIIDDLISGTKIYMAKNGYKHIKDFVGKALDNIIPADKLDRDTVVFPKFDPDKCIGCGRCYISCSDAGHQALTFTSDHKIKLNGSKCVGCHLCSLVCPTGAIEKTKRILKPNRK
ncbi:MAG: NAD-dependent dihydropyrimidine dehydrogenase subunit PreA [Anaeroplasmataceae bacterium]